MSNQFEWIPTKIKFRFEFFHQMVFTKHEIISVLRVTTWNYILVKIFLISHYSWQLVLFLLLHNRSSLHWEMIMFPPLKCHWNLAVKTLLAAWRVLVGDGKHILDDEAEIDTFSLAGSIVAASLKSGSCSLHTTSPPVTSFITKKMGSECSLYAIFLVF